MQQYQRPSLVQSQRLKMTPQLLQSIQIMALPLQDLKLRIEEELEQNPALEVTEEQGTVSLDTSGAGEHSEEYEYFENSSDPGYISSSGSSDPDAKQQFMENALSREESLQEHLIWQLHLQPIDEEEYRIGELLIRNLDANGFHLEDPTLLVSEEELPILERLCAMIQTFDPPGCCVSDYKESLLVQAAQVTDLPEGTEEILRDHLELLERGKYKEIARKTGISEAEVEEALEFIRHLTPFPGRLYGSDKPEYVIPDLLLEMRDGQFVLVMNDEELPVLGINSFFSDLSEQRANEKDVRQFVNGRVKDARWFINSIQQRNQTLMKVGRAIVEFQRDFFFKGKKYLKPLTLRDIAQEVGVHEATVSRITNGKYLQTEWGIFELKYFFSNSISGAGSSGSRYSKEGVKEVIREIILQEQGEKHLSDQKIADLLSKRGINLARRTVAKYRKELDISSSYER
ncbi:MAG: RNA polymerase factor sigma-54 [Alkalispirochaetaceae bacterium]